MTLKAYGVVLGSKAGYHRDAPNNFGKFFHGHIDIQTPGQLYNTAIDVDSERAGVRVQWKRVVLRPDEWLPIFGLTDGFHSLVSDANSGAVDYLRDGRLRTYRVLPVYIDGPVPWWKRPFPWWHRVVEIWKVISERVFPKVGMRGPALTQAALQSRVRTLEVTPPWKIGTDIEALTDLEAMLVDAARVVVFGESYPSSGARPPGLHDIHQNQGDPIGSSFSGLDGIWQDGLTIVIHSDGTAVAFMNKFSTQSDETDNQGRPVP